MSDGNEHDNEHDNEHEHDYKSKNKNLEERINVNPLRLGKQSLKKRLEAYYSLIAPDAIADEVEWQRKFDLIYKKYGGSEKGERALSMKLCKKYGNIVRLRLGLEEGERNGNGGNDHDDDDTNRRSALSVQKRDESWYDLLPCQRDSGVIDFVSEKFDPFAALRVQSSSDPSCNIYKVNPFIQTSPLLDNLSKFEPHLPACDPLKRILSVSIRERRNKHKRKHDSTATSTAERTAKRKLPILASFVSRYEHAGPLSLLYNIHTKKQRIRVMIRYTDCIRSTLTGYLLAFDKVRKRKWKRTLLISTQ